MAIGANSYGDPAEIAALTPRWAKSGVFDTTSSPKLATVESWCDQVSATLNNILQEHGFEVPVTQADVKLMLDSFVNDEVASMVEGVHGVGRFGPEARGRSSNAPSRNSLIMADAQLFIQANAAGMQRLGATRDVALIGGGIGHRDTDDSGDTPQPLFQREAFGESYKLEDS